MFKCRRDIMARTRRYSKFGRPLPTRMSSSLVQVRSVLGLSRTRPPPILLRRVSPHFCCQLRLTPLPLLRRTFAATHWVQYARPSPVLKSDPGPPQKEADSRERQTLRENIYTIPNLLTASRIFACPVLGWSILHDDFYLATGLLVYAGLSDLVSDTS